MASKRSPKSAPQPKSAARQPGKKESTENVKAQERELTDDELGGVSGGLAAARPAVRNSGFWG
jgi:hypothetical protein